MTSLSLETEVKKARKLTIRPIAPQDDAALETLVINILTEFGCVGPGYASSDPELKSLSTVYTPEAGQASDRAYWVIVDEDTNEVLGGGGFSRLKGTTEADSICELQKVYFRPELRGLGFGRKILDHCLEGASRAGYRTMYLESTPQMKSAVGIYEKLGFQHIPGPLGNTGHTSCTVFMTRQLG